ncbi:4-hydroxy-3-methylbut-2-en-1-yl diphosphate synthase [Thermodesulfitimonas autotrophica]|uniref:4-hydroxy-3-methylbut-2-en-1-yl diphosphate synthase (flavodoxin) n=1 Tax=Thermodesulfitimonas autotrophica TaxID=1894989 RepID=A0A3N5B2A3_9THEO|nr:flavodoxin-dependent (E)-4-hydroxy-3-methylbut-2-enyl-diphosphate synthase [Thermodesulfitimonas autotrophica]RPF49690.1 4-hydroxy-3-methylbut-2-en-1-yl diphosphate synthase [Thermodesulfitimonas autotrophica]
MRRVSRPVWVGGVQVGGGAPVVVQSMTNTDTRDVDKTVAQIEELASWGCELVRVAVPDAAAAAALRRIKAASPIPVIADIHFDYRLALAALEAGVDGLRINPGNIGGRERVRLVVTEAKRRGVPIRVGVNAGSLERRLLEKYGGVTAGALVESALDHIRLLEEMDFTAIKVSVKAADVPLMVEAYRRLARAVDYPLHVGVTEAGTLRAGLVRSAVGIGILLSEGIGDTIRVSLTAPPRHEVWAAWEILKALGLRRRGVELISCPTCGRCEIDLVAIATEVEERLQKVTVPLKVAVMGCVVNGPGEAREADVGIAGGKGVGLLFRKGEPLRTVPEAQLVEELLREIRSMGIEGL